MTISVFKELKIFDAGSKGSVEEIISRINIKESFVTLDLSRCIIDYPATSLLIDKVLMEICKKKKPGELIIQTHLNIIESLLIHWLFIGSHFFKIEDSKKKMSLSEFTSIISSTLSSKKLIIKLQIVDKRDQILKEFVYGAN